MSTDSGSAPRYSHRWDRLRAENPEHSAWYAQRWSDLAAAGSDIDGEARLATAPVVQELASSSHSNGNLDRAGMAGLAARKTGEVASLCRSIAAVELMVAAQAVDIRRATPLGTVTGKLHALVREVTPFAAAGDRVPHLDPLLRHLAERREAIRDLLEPA